MQISSVSEVAAVLRDTSHNGFPVVRHTDGDGSDGQLVGIILRSQVLLMLEQRAIFEADEATMDRPTRFGVSLRLPRLTGEQLYLDRLMRVYHHTHYPHRRYLSSRPEAVSELEIDDLLQVFSCHFEQSQSVWCWSLRITKMNSYQIELGNRKQHGSGRTRNPYELNMRQLFKYVICI